MAKKMIVGLCTLENVGLKWLEANNMVLTTEFGYSKDETEIGLGLRVKPGKDVRFYSDGCVRRRGKLIALWSPVEYASGGIMGDGSLRFARSYGCGDMHGDPRGADMDVWVADEGGVLVHNGSAILVGDVFGNWEKGVSGIGDDSAFFRLLNKLDKFVQKRKREAIMIEPI